MITLTVITLTVITIRAVITPHSTHNIMTNALLKFNYLHISGIFLHVTDRDALIAMDRYPPSLVDITLAMVTWITPLQLIRITG